MERHIDLEKISDGKLYDSNDLVRVDCNDCQGCSSCCRDMGDSILLDPMDICLLTGNLKKSFDALVNEGSVALHINDGLILPNLNMENSKNACSFLTETGRCGIHAFRPGICRLFPLGRLYEDGSFRYFLQVQECAKEHKSKVKIKKWLGMPDIRRYEQFILDWHYFCKNLQERIKAGAEEEWTKQVNLYILQVFYRLPYKPEDFYEQFAGRLAEAKAAGL